MLTLATGCVRFSCKYTSIDFKRMVHGLNKFPPLGYRRDQDGPLDYSSRNYNYMMIGATGVVGTVFAKNAVGNFIASLTPGRNLMAIANIEVDLEDIKEGQVQTLAWRGKPLVIWHRDQNEIDEVRSVPQNQLVDPQKDEDRVQKEEYLIVLGICTHLGCVPIHHHGDYGGFFCPCHGSHYDASGRIRQGPAPRNLDVPPYHFKGDSNRIIVGISKEDAEE
jgi:ubiquinol-cytochrome c reductase iron-sulfur subunit